MGFIRDLLPQIEAAKASGIKYPKIVEAINQQGFEINLSTFRNIMARLNKEQAKAGTKLPPTQAGKVLKGTAQAATSPIEQVSDAAPAGSLPAPEKLTGGQSPVEAVLNKPTQHFSFKKQQKAKE